MYVFEHPLPAKLRRNNDLMQYGLLDTRLTLLNLYEFMFLNTNLDERDSSMLLRLWQLGSLMSAQNLLSSVEKYIGYGQVSENWQFPRVLSSYIIHDIKFINYWHVDKHVHSLFLSLSLPTPLLEGLLEPRVTKASKYHWE